MRKSWRIRQALNDGIEIAVIANVHKTAKWMFRTSMAEQLDGVF
jgi:hypothetical protein